MTPAGTANELDVQYEWEENTKTHTRSTQKLICVPRPKRRSEILGRGAVGDFRGFHILLEVDGPQRIFLGYQSHLLMLQGCHPIDVCGHEGFSHLFPVLAYKFLSRCKFSALTT